MQDWERRIRFLETMLQTRARNGDLILRCYKDRSGYRYYIKQNGLRFMLKDPERIRQFAQELYDRKLCQAAERELCSLRSGRYDYPGVKVENVFERLHPGIQAQIVPYWDLQDSHVQAWLSRSYETMLAYEKKYVSQRGSWVRSKSEWLIDDLLFEYGLPAIYERELVLPSGQIRYPDFTIWNPFTCEEIYWEHFGMMDNPEYAEKAVVRIQEYTRNVFTEKTNMIFTFESRRYPLTRPYLMVKMNEAFPEAVSRVDHHQD